MKLINKDNKIYLYDNIEDKYKLISPDDLEHILDDNNQLLPDETIRIYFNFKEGKYKGNKKGYIAKKANIKQEYKEVLDTTQKNYIVQKFLNDVTGLNEIDKLAFIKKPSISTIKRFSIDENTKNRLINKFNEISKNYITIKDDGDDIDDMFDYFLSNNVNVSLSKAAREVVKNILKDFREGKITVLDVKDKLLLNKDKFYNPNKPDNYEKFIEFLEQTILKYSNDELKNKDKNEEINNALNTVNKKIDETIPDLKTLVLSNDQFENEEAFNEASYLNKNNKFIPSEIFKSSKIKQFDNIYFGTNAKAYRILKYLSTNESLNINNIEYDDDKDTIKITLDIGEITIPLDKDQYLYQPLKTIIKESEKDIDKFNFPDDIFDNQGNDINTLKKLSISTDKTKKYSMKDKNKSIFDYKITDEDIEDILNKLGNDITTSEYVNFIDYYYENYDKDYIKPDKEFKGRRTVG